MSKEKDLIERARKDAKYYDHMGAMNTVQDLASALERTLERLAAVSKFIKQCKVCQLEFVPKFAESRMGKALFCSRRCRSIWIGQSSRPEGRTYRLQDDLAYIPLGDGTEAVIDAADAEMALVYSSWHRQTGRGGRYYVKASAPDRKAVSLHRLVIGLETPNTLHIDHIDGDTLNNRRSNLRVCSAAQNGWNRGPTRTNTSGFKGASFCKRSGKWIANITRNKKREFLGYFSTAEEAGAAYKAASEKTDGEFAWRKLRGEG